MARPLRIQYPGAMYHVRGRGNERKEIFRGAEDYQWFLEKLSDSLDVYNVSLLGYVCMINHYHSVLEYFGGDTREGRAAYRQFVYRGMDKGETNPLEIGKGSGIIGTRLK